MEVLFLVALLFGASSALERLGDISTLAHAVRGTVYEKDEGTLVVKDFYYDGTGPDAFFYVGTSGSEPNGDTGIIVPYPEGAGADVVLQRADGAEVELVLPPGVEASDLRWLSVWCRRYSVDFGNVVFDRGNDDDNDDETKAEPESEGTAEGEGSDAGKINNINAVVLLAVAVANSLLQL